MDDKLGRPTKYKEEYDEQAYKLCLLGATDKEIANFFNVTEQTINNWKNDFPSFFESLRKGKELADMRVVNSLLESCHDRMIPTQQAFKTRNVTWKDGKKVETEVVVVVDVGMGVQANDRSIKFWLQNRHPDKWRDKQDVKIEGEIGITWKEEKTYEVKQKADDSPR